MEARAATWNKDIQDAATQLKFTMADRILPGENTAEWVRDSMFWMIKTFQAHTDTITWLAAKRQGMEKFDGDNQLANDFADRAVARSQASGIFGERTPFERGSFSPTVRQTELIRSFTPFMSYFAAKINVAYERTKRTNFRNPFEAMKWARDMLMLTIIEASIAAVIQNRWPDEDDDESFVTFAVAEGAHNILAGVPILRDVSGVLQGFRGGGTPRGALLEDFAKAAKQASQGEVDEALLKSINNVGGVLFHYPSAQINRSFSAAIRHANDEDILAHEFLLGPKFKRN
jgi:hypothetical protein